MVLFQDIINMKILTFYLFFIKFSKSVFWTGHISFSLVASSFLIGQHRSRDRREKI